MIITEFRSRRSAYGTVRDTTWEELVHRLEEPVRTTETMEEYANLTSEQKTEIKDVGGYVAGEFAEGKRGKLLLKSRCILTIDADHAIDASLDIMRDLYDDICYFVHSTHTSTKDSLRLRWLFPLKRPVDSAEYRYLCSVVKEWVGEESIDETTDQPERLMFWPSISSDAEYICEYHGGDFLDPDELLEGVDLTAFLEKAEQEQANRDVVAEGLIPNGTRDNTLTRLAGVFQQAGLPDELCQEFLARTNAMCCETPLPDADVKRICKSILRKSKGDLVKVQDRDDDYDFGDLGDKLDTDSVEKKTGRNVIDISAAENGNALRDRDIPDTDFIVPGLIPECGLGLIIAPPKTGKSWLAMDIAISVATGTPLLGVESKQAETLYLALEDFDKRIKRRMLKVAGADEDRQDLGKFYHAEAAPTTEGGLTEELDKHLRKHPDAKLVIIDTLQKVRGNAKRTESAYQYDYRDVGILQAYAITRQICLILVHHTRKARDADELLSNASGTNGVSGVVDFGMELAKKNWSDKQAQLKVTGRDVDNKTYIVTFNDTTCRWENLGEEKDVRQSEDEIAYSTDPVVRAIKDKLSQAESKPEGIEDFDDPVTWEVSLQDLLSISRYEYGGSPVSTPRALGGHLNKLAYQLEHIDSITFTSVHRRGGDVRVFSRPRTV